MTSILARERSLRSGYPFCVRVKKQKQDHAQSHQIHVDQKKNASMVEAPTPLHASHRIDGTGESDEDRQHEKRIGVDHREP
jgi:hypothetical protein